MLYKELTESLPLQHFDVKEHFVPASHIREYPGATIGSQEEVLYNHVKQYVPKAPIKDEKNAVTFICSMGVGLPKEIYEPLWDELYTRSEANGYSIRGIWAAEMTNLGYSGIVNEAKNSMGARMMDHTRDLFLIVNQFRQEMPRPIVGLGYSAGAAQLVHLSYMHPRLFTTLILLEPALQPDMPPLGFNGQPTSTVNFLVHRQDVWRNHKDLAST